LAGKDGLGSTKPVTDGNGGGVGTVIPPIAHVALRIHSTPPGASVKVGGEKRGVANPNLQVEVPPGQVTVRLELEGYAPQEKVVPVGKEGEKLEFFLKPLGEVKYALLVGVHTPGGGLADFPHAEPDVVELGRVLVPSGYAPKNVTVLTQWRGEKPPNPRSTLAGIRAGLAHLKKVCTPADTVLVALVGRQVQGPMGQECFVCPGADLGAHPELLPVPEVLEALGNCQARFKLLLLDGWRPAWVPDGQTMLPIKPGRTRMDMTMAPGGVAVFASCSPGETAYEHPQDRHGLFFQALIRGLHGYAVTSNAGQVTLGDLEGYVQGQVKTLAAKRYRVRQQPDLQGGEAGRSRVLATVPPLFDDFRRGCDNLEKKEYALAVAALSAAVRDDEHYVEGHTRRAEAYLGTKEFDKAAGDCKEALELDPFDATAWSLEGDAHLGRGEFQPGLEAFDRAIQLDPQFAGAYNYRGLASLNRGNREVKDGNVPAARGYYLQAEQDFKRAGELNPKLAWPYANLGLLHLKQRDSKALGPLSEKERQRKLLQAIDEFEEATRRDPEEATHYFRLGTAYRIAGKLDQAAIQFDRAIKLDDTSAAAYRGRADVKADRMDYEGAINDYNQAIKRGPGDKYTHLGRGRALLKFGDPGRAEADFTQAIQIDPNFILAYRERIEAYRAQGKVTKAQEDMRKLQSLENPGSGQ
jgi:tetratricopeptide (TPR) repeat protein